MTTVIDERVVEMRFNNEDFEKNVAQSMNTLDQLKKSLNFDSGKSLEDLGKATKGFSLNGISEAVTSITSKFSALEIAGVTAIANITNKAVNAGISLIKNLTIDQVTEGFDKYASKTSAVQTIMAATAKEFSNQATQMAYVNEQMDKLMWFTDETSYNFIDMVGNIGKFTNNGVKLDQAVTAMQGIAQWAGISGATTQEASRAMYNFSQAMGAGAMKLQDWKSIENANMATMEFKQIAADTAVELGKLEKVSDGVYQTMEGNVFTLSKFSSYLKDAWFTADVMVSSLSKYGDFTNMLYEASEATELTATELLKYIDQYKAGEMDLAKVSEETGVSIQELDGYMKNLADETNDLGLRSFKASQEAKTFAEAIASVKDAVSSQWMKTSEFIFGDYLQAKALWTGLANTMWEVFAAEGERRNDTLSKWKERNSLIEAFVNILNLAYKPLMAIRDAWHSMFPATAANRAKILDDLTIKFKNFTAAIQPSQKTLNGLKYTFQGIFNIFKISFKIVTSVIKALFPIAKPFGSLIEMLVTFTGYVGIIITAISEYADEIGAFSKVTEFLAALFDEIIGRIREFVGAFGGPLLAGLVQFISFIIKAVASAGSFVGSVFKDSNLLSTVITKVANAIDFLKKAITGLFKPAEKATTVMRKATVYYGEAAAITAQTGTVTRQAGEDFKKAASPLELVANTFLKVGKVVLGVGAIIVGSVLNTGKAIFAVFDMLAKRTNTASSQTQKLATSTKSSFSGILGPISNIGSKIGEFFKSLFDGSIDVKKGLKGVTDALKDFITNVNGGQVAAIALSIGLLAVVAASIKLAKKLGDTADSVLTISKTLTSTIAGIGSSIRGTLNGITKYLDKMASKSLLLDTIKTFAIAFGVVAASLTVLTLVDTNKLKTVSLIMAGFIGVFTILTGVVVHLAKKMNDAKLLLNFRSLAKSIILLSTSMAILALSASILASAKIEGGIPQLYAKLGALIVMLGGVVGAAIALSKFSKDLPKGAILLLAIALAMRTLAKALMDFATIPLENINDHWATYLSIFTGLSLFLAAAGHVKVSSAFALLALASAMKIILPAVSEIVTIAKELPYERICQAATENIGGIVLFFSFLITALAFLVALIEGSKAKIEKAKAKGKGNLFGGIGGAFAGIGIGIALIVESIKRLHDIYDEFDEGEIANIAALFGGIMTIMTLSASLIIIAKKFFGAGKDDAKVFSSLAVLFVGMGVSLRIMASAIKAMSTIEDMGKAWQAVVMIGLLGVVLSLVVNVSGTVPKAMPAMVTLIAATVAMGVLIGELAILSLLVDAPGINKALGIMAGLFVALNITMRSLERIQYVKAGPLIALVGALLVIGGSLYLLSEMDLASVLSAAGAMAGVMVALMFLMKVIDQMDTPSVRKLVSLGATIVAIDTIGLALNVAARQDWKSILAAGSMMSLALIAIGGVLIVLDKIGSQGGQLTAAGAIVMISAAMLVIAGAISVLDGVDWSAIGKFAAAMGIMAGVLTVLALITAFFPPFGAALGVVAISLIATAAAFAIAAVAFIGFGIALPLLAEGLNQLTPALQAFSTIDFLTIGAGLVQLAWGLGAVGLAGAVVGIGAIGLGLLALSLGALGLVAPTAAEGLSKLAEVPLVDIALGLGAIGVAGAVVGALSPLILIASAAIAAFAAALLLLQVAIQAVSGLFSSFTTALGNAGQSIKNTVENIKTTIKGLMPDIKSAFAGSNANAAIAAATKFGKGLAGTKASGAGLLGGLAAVLIWHSPPGVIKDDLMNDTAAAFESNGTAVAAATASGAEIGNGFGSQMATTVSGWLSSIGSGVSGFFSSFTKGGKAVSSLGSDLDSTGAQAEKFGKTMQKTKYTGIDIVDNAIGGIKEKVDDLKNGVTDFIDVEEFLPEDLMDIGEAATGAGGGLDDFSEAAEKAGKSGKSASDNLKDLKSTLEGQLDIFSKFEIKTDMTSETLLDNMKSNIDGFASWSHRMTVLAERFVEHGISDTLYTKLEELGPKGYETMNAIYNMTDEQLDELRTLWETGLTLPENQADIVNSGFKYMGEMAAQGFSNALDDHKAAHDAANGLGKAALDGLREALDVHSPSQETFKIGVFLIDGLGLGMTSSSALAMLELCVSQVSQKVIELFTENLSPEKMGPVGEGLLEKLFANVLGGANKDTNPIITAFTTGLMKLEPVNEALTAFVEAVTSFLNIMFKMGDSTQPSLLFYEYGKNSTQGYVNGLSQSLGYIHTQIIIMGMKVAAWLSAENFTKKFYDIGKNATLGFANGLADSEAARKVQRNAEEIARKAIETMQSATKEHSPSKLTQKIGYYLSEGLAIGIEDGASHVYKAAQTVAEEGIEVMDDMGRLQDVFDNELDLNPVITPMLDLSVVRAQMAELNSMFNSGMVGPYAGQNGGQFTANPEPTSINFTQNNYSPKELSRYDIYRNTKNQISMMKGVMRANA